MIHAATGTVQKKVQGVNRKGRRDMEKGSHQPKTGKTREEDQGIRMQKRTRARKRSRSETAEVGEVPTW
jgi:hypothetical protein